MSDDTIPTTAPEPTPDTTEKAKRQRNVWPIRICRIDNGGMFPLKGGPSFAETRDANDWIDANVKPGEPLIPARYPDTAKLVTISDMPFP